MDHILGENANLVSIIIAHRDDALGASQHSLGLWATIHSIELDLHDSDITYEYCIVTSSDSEKLNPDTYNVIEYVRRSGKLGYHGHKSQVLSPPAARQQAADNSTGQFLFFFDNHCLVKAGYFKRALSSMCQYNMDMLHSTTAFFMQEPKVYHYNLKLEKNFWAEGSEHAKNYNNPYRIAAGGHGGFVVRANVFREVNGYWDGFKGYGGEEIYFDLKMAMLDKTNWIDPQLIHYHFAGNRGYPRHYTDEFYVNMLAVANILGGEKWLNKVYDSFSRKYSKVKTGKTMFDLLDMAQEVSCNHASEFKAFRHRNLDEQLMFFAENNIAH